MNWKWIAVTGVVALSGCTSDTDTSLQAPLVTTSQVDPTLFEKIVDTAFVDSAEKGAGNGGVWNASAYKVRQGRSVTVYRVARWLSLRALVGVVAPFENEG